ncbi:hypothetical protein Val02_66750 [Virgisporangium aliadipatigenens]|uniref:Adenylate kinase n=1 Tax=Virgisporangium aliadipatigenens TaxID=741659 RepID=A0A8J3YQ77_9ACTN|nr:hypothetical protein Val02_66750 [Virgisporangium aliadipatigenens]
MTGTPAARPLLPRPRLFGELPTAFVALIGPPAVGKSTVAAALAEEVGATTFRLREFAQQSRIAGLLAAELFATTDPLGWFPDGTVDALLRAAFLYGRFPAEGVIVLESFPGNAVQLHLLHDIGRLRGAPLMVVELDAAPEVVMTRARARRVCPTCEPDPTGDPHAPAAADPDAPERCGRCDGALARRCSDRLDVIPARFGRYRHRLDAIRTCATQLDMPYRRIHASADRAAVASAVRSEIASIPGIRTAAVPSSIR